MILVVLRQSLGKMPILVAFAQLLICSSVVGHLQQLPNYVARYEPNAQNYSRSRRTSGNILHVSHSLPGRSSISITRGSTSSSRPRLASQISGSILPPSAQQSNHGTN